MRSLKSLAVATAIIFGVVIATACGSSEGDPGDGSSGGASGGPIGGDPGSSGQLPGGQTPADELKGCASETKKATPLPLDLYIMFDSSGSMASLIAANKSKYTAAVDAMNAFLSDPASDGIGVGLQFFPLNQAGVPATCTDKSQCPGSTGPCTSGYCGSNAGGPKQQAELKFCTVETDCPQGPYTCVTSGHCSIATNVFCPPPFGVYSCGNDPNGFPRGTCVASNGGWCANGDSCVAADYSKPAVAIGALPGSKAALANALATKKPQGGTPTSAALQGAIDTAVAYAKANPTHTVAVVFATDGNPEQCDTNITNISNIAGGAFTGTPSVRTFVVGVFASAAEKTALQPNLDAIAAKGGTNKAYLTNAAATTEFQKALASIRGNALPCDYDVPKPTSGLPDFEKVNVQHTTTDGAKTVFGYTASATSCDPTNGGWYYDKAPAPGADPTKIVLCPATCNRVRNEGGQVDVVLGCKTVIK
jgi:hypothetical protein